MRSLVAAFLLVLSPAIAGCLGDPEPADANAAGTPDVDQIVEALVAPVFGSPVAIPFPPVSIGGEPSIAAAPDGTIYISAPMIPISTIFLGSEAQGYVWRSDDGGATYTMLNDENGKLGGDACGNGDTDTAVDDMGRVYMVDLCGGIPFYVSSDRGETWTATEDVTQRKDGDTMHSRDRQWIDALGDGHVLVSVAGSEDADVRSIIFVQSRDAGVTWSEKQVLTTKMIQLGPMVFVDHATYAMPYIEPEGGEPVGTPAGIVHILLTTDGGVTWSDTALERRVTPATGVLFGGWSPTHIFPVLEADAAGNLYLVWSEDTADHLGSQLVFTRSLDRGATWAEPVEITTGGNAIFPWLAAGTDGRLAVAYLRADTPLEPNRSPGPWYVHVLQTITGSADAVEWVDARAVPDPIHVGGICQNGGGCLFAGDSIGDRTLLDFFEITIVPTTGQAAIAYTTDPPQEGKQVRMGAVVQTGGTSLVAGKTVG